MKNRFEVLGETTKVYSTGKNSHLHFIIDTTDLEKISVMSWRIYPMKNGYIRVEGGYFSNGKKTSVVLARYILDTPKGIMCDHKDCNPLNNRRNNLRFATPLQNSQNAPKHKTITSSKYKGVCYHKLKRLWFAYINSNGKRYNIGYFRNQEDAALAYNRKCQELNNDFAYLNEIHEVLAVAR